MIHTLNVLIAGSIYGMMIDKYRKKDLIGVVFYGFLSIIITFALMCD